MVRTEEARRIHRAWYTDEFHRNKDEKMSRLDTYTERFMMLLAISAEPRSNGALSAPLVTPDIARAALSMARWQFQVRQRHTPIIADTRAAKAEQNILRAAKAAGEQGCNQRELQKRTNAHRLGLDTWAKAFHALQANGNLVPLEPMPTARGGRPAQPRWRYVFE